LVEVLLLVR